MLNCDTLSGVAIEHVDAALRLIQDKAHQSLVRRAGDVMAFPDRLRSRNAVPLIQEAMADTSANWTVKDFRVLSAGMAHEQNEVEAEQYTVTLVVRVTTAMSKEIKQAAAIAGVSVSDEIRRRLDDGK